MRSLFGFGVVLLLSVSWVQVAAGECSGAVVNLPDSNLEAALREVLAKPTGDLTESDLCSLTTLDLSNRNISNLTGLGAAVNLTSLSIDSNNLSDVGPLTTLTKLTSLTVSNNNISDVAPLATLTELQNLSLSHNALSDLSALGTLDKLWYLDIDNNLFTNIHFYGDMNQLRLGGLNVRGNPLDAFTVCTSIPNIRTTLSARVDWDNGCIPGYFAETCSNPEIIELNERKFVDTFRASGNDVVSSCGTGEAADVWLAFAPPYSGDFVFSTAGSSIETVMTVYGSCGGPEMACTLDDVTLPLSYGQYYFIRLAGTNGAKDGVTLIVTAVPCADATPVPIPDAKLESAIRSALGKPVGDILKSDMCTLTQLQANAQGISDLTGLETCSDLRYVNLSDNPITSLEPIGDLSTLLTLDVSGTAITSVAALNNHPSLAHLKLDRVTSLNFSGTSIPSVTLLTCREAALSNLSPLVAAFPSVYELYIAKNNVTDLAPLSGLPNLHTLEAYSNDISVLTPLAGKTGMLSLNLSDNTISDIAPLAGLTALTSLNLAANNISNISALSGLPGPVNVNLSSNEIVEITPLLNNLNFATGDTVDLTDNPLSSQARCVDSITIKTRGATVQPNGLCVSGTDNDTCEEAIELMPGVTLEGTSTGSTDPLFTPDSELSICDEPMGSGGVYFSYTATDAGYAKISTCGSSFDTFLSIANGCSQVAGACEDTGSCGSAAELTVPVIEGAIVLFRLSSLTGATGIYNVLVTEISGEEEAEYEPETGYGCEEDALLSQPCTPNPTFLGVPSDTGLPVDDPFEFTAVENTRITGVTVWGQALTEGGSCEITSMRVQARLDKDGSPGDTLYYSELSSAVASETVFEGGEYPVSRFEVTLSKPLDVHEDGVWLRVMDETALNCVFFWMISPTGDGTHGFFETAEGEFNFLEYDMSLCVYGEPLTEGEGSVEGGGEGGSDGEGEGISEGEGITEGEGEGTAEGEGEGEDGIQTSDQDGDFQIALAELLRVIQLYNAGAFHCAENPGDTEDGYIPGAGTDQTCEAYDTDYNPQDWVISLSELLRNIQYYNFGGYTYCPLDGTEDGFCPGL